MRRMMSRSHTLVMKHRTKEREVEVGDDKDKGDSAGLESDQGEWVGCCTHSPQSAMLSYRFTGLAKSSETNRESRFGVTRTTHA